MASLTGVSSSFVMENVLPGLQTALSNTNKACTIKPNDQDLRAASETLSACIRNVESILHGPSEEETNRNSVGISSSFI
ncbi:MAG: hypothetical protein EPN84_10295 [Legionella sp.]|nr:MAG: hypothetical protein EPN84_10295 [Legionella sp.]